MGRQRQTDRQRIKQTYGRTDGQAEVNRTEETNFDAVLQTDEKTILSVILLLTPLSAVREVH